MSKRSEFAVVQDTLPGLLPILKFACGLAQSDPNLAELLRGLNIERRVGGLLVRKYVDESAADEREAANSSIGLPNQ